MYNGFIMREDEWATGLSEEVWNARPEDSEKSARDRIQKRKKPNRVWTNNFGDEFREGDRILIKKHTFDFGCQAPTYTSDMAERYEETEQVIDKILDSDDVCLKDEGFTWHLDWLKPIEPPLPEELFEI
jgi:hypothetical protein